MTLDDLPTPPAAYLFRGVCYHWTAGRYNAVFRPTVSNQHGYTFCVLGPPRDGEIVLTCPPLANLRNITGGLYAAHVLRRNSGRIGISASAMYGASMNNFGAFPVTPKQIEAMCALGALCIVKYHQPGQSLGSLITDHYTFAQADGYYPDRWDLQPLTHALVGKTKWYVGEIEAGRL